MSEETEDAVEAKAEAAEKSATTLELFFDLVFVFAITQVVSLLAHDLTWSGLFHATILLGILWWGWTNWTWVTNLVSLGPRTRRIVLLAGMVGTFIMAYAVPEAFEGSGLWVAVPYIVTTILASALMFMDAEMTGVNMSGLLRYMPLNFLGAALLVVGTNFGEAQQWFWLGALAVNVLAAELSGSQEWAVDAKHFAERHGLIMIIALGEAIIAVGASLSDPPSWELAGYLMTGVGFAIILYWAYFDRAQEIWEEGLRKASVSETGDYARDVYTLTHFSMIVGIVFSAVALEEAFLNPHEPLEPFAQSLLVVAVACFFLGQAVAAYRANQVILTERIVAVGLTAAVVYGLSELDGPKTVLVVALLLAATMTAEYFHYRSKIHPDMQTA